MSVESATLQKFLDQQRRQVFGTMEGLSDDEMRAPILPSGWNCVQMLQHLAVDEKYWFQWCAAGEDISHQWYDDMPDADNDWLVAPGLTPATALQRYRQAIDDANKAIAGLSLDAFPIRSSDWWEGAFGHRGPITVRWIILHMIEETARHAGHLDAVRELIDGHTWT